MDVGIDRIGLCNEQSPYKSSFEVDVSKGPENSLFWKVDLTDFVNNNYRSKIVIPDGQKQTFDAEYSPCDFHECIEIPAQPCLPETSCTSTMQWHSPRRQRSVLNLRPMLSPLEYRDGVTCYIGSSKRRFKSTTWYEPRMRSTDFSETCFVLPQRKDVHYITEMNAKRPLQRGNYVSMVTLVPKTYSHNTVLNFEADKWEIESCSSDNASTDITTDDDLEVMMEELDSS